MGAVLHLWRVVATQKFMVDGTGVGLRKGRNYARMQFVWGHHEKFQGALVMLRMVRLVVLLLLCSGMYLQAQDVYRDWNRRVCPLLDRPFRSYRGVDITHILAADTGTTGWGDSVSVTDVQIWGRLPSWENDFGGELEIRGHSDLRVLQGLKAGSGVDRQHGFLMLRGVAEWHQRFLGGFGMQARIQPGIYTALSTPAGNIFSVPVGLTLVQAFHPDFAVFAGADYYPDFDAGIDPLGGILYTRHRDFQIQVGYPETRMSLRPYGGRFALGLGADFIRWPEYRLGRDDDNRRIRFRENQTYMELSWDTRGFTQVDLRVGYMFRRRATLSGGETVALDDSPFVALGFSALL